MGQHGANIYFKEFTVSASSEVKTYKLGAFYFVRKSLEYPVAIAEFQLIWKNTKDGKTYASVKLYFNPNDINPDVHKFEGIGKVCLILILCGSIVVLWPLKCLFCYICFLHYS